MEAGARERRRSSRFTQLKTYGLTCKVENDTRLAVLGACSEEGKARHGRLRLIPSPPILELPGVTMR
jgi:hypothetical protein